MPTSTARRQTPDCPDMSSVKLTWHTEMSLADWGDGLVYYGDLDPRCVYEVTGCYVTKSLAVYVRGYLFDSERFIHRLAEDEKSAFLSVCPLVGPDGTRVLPAKTRQESEAEARREEAKARFRSEYAELKGRYGRLHSIIVGYEAGTLSFTPSCPLELLKRQASAMGQYLYCLEVRAEIEGVKLSD